MLPMTFYRHARPNETDVFEQALLWQRSSCFAQRTGKELLLPASCLSLAAELDSFSMVGPSQTASDRRV